MSCTPFSLAAGRFSYGTWTVTPTTPTAPVGGKTVQRTSSGVQVTGPGGTLLHSYGGVDYASTSGTPSHYVFGGTNHTLLLLDATTPSGGSTTYSVTLIMFSGTAPPTQRLLFSATLLTKDPDPNVQFSVDGNAVLAYSVDPLGTGIANLAIWRADTGDSICAYGATFHPAGASWGGYALLPPTPTNVGIAYFTASGSISSVIVSCPLPAAVCEVIPGSFPTAVFGAAPPCPNFKTAIYAIWNMGNDCLVIDSIGSAGPFAAVGPPFSLGPMEHRDVTVTFTPTSAGPSGAFTLPIVPAPAHGATGLVCSATARNAEHRVQSASSVDFGRVCVGSTKTVSLAAVTNTGELPVTVTVPGSGPGPFTWPPSTTTLPPCTTPRSVATINVTFAPTSPAPFAATLTVLTNAPGAGVVNIALTGQGAPAEAVIRVDGASFDFGRVMPQACLERCFSVANDGCATMLLVLASSGDPFFVSDGSGTLPADARLITTVGGLSGREFCVTFSPQTEGGFSDDLIVASSDARQPLIRFPMSGVGEIRPPNVADWRYNVRILGQQSKAAPAVAEFERKLHMVHLGKSSNRLWWSTLDGRSWSENLEIPSQKSKAPVSLAAYGGALHLVHLGDTSNNIWWSIYNGSTWSPNVVIPGQKSKAAPALAVYDGKLHMVHLGDSSNDIWWSTYDGAWSHNVLIAGQKSKASPALAVYDGKLHMVHLGDSSNNIWWSTYDGTSWSTNVVIPGQRSKLAPALAVFGGLLHMVHAGDTSNRLWWSVFDARTNTWSVNDYLRDGQASRDTAGLGAYIAGCALVMVHVGTSSTNLWYATYPLDGRNP